MWSSSFLPTASPIDLPFKVNSYLRLPFVPHQRAKLPSAAKCENITLTEAATIFIFTFPAVMVLVTH